MRYTDDRGMIVFESSHESNQYTIIFEWEEDSTGILKRATLSLPDFEWMMKVFKHLQHQTGKRASLNERRARIVEYLCQSGREFDDMMYQ